MRLFTGVFMSNNQSTSSIAFDFPKKLARNKSEAKTFAGLTVCICAKSCSSECTMNPEKTKRTQIVIPEIGIFQLKHK